MLPQIKYPIKVMMRANALFFKVQEHIRSLEEEDGPVNGKWEFEEITHRESCPAIVEGRFERG